MGRDMPKDYQAATTRFDPALAASSAAFNNDSLRAALAASSAAVNNDSLRAALAASSAVGKASSGSRGYAALIAGLDTSSLALGQDSTWDDFQQVQDLEEFAEACNHLSNDEDVVARVAEVVGAVGTGAADEQLGPDELAHEGAMLVEVTDADLAMTAVFVMVMVFGVVTWLYIAHRDVYDYVCGTSGLLLNLVALMIAVQKPRSET